MTTQRTVLVVVAAVGVAACGGGGGGETAMTTVTAAPDTTVASPTTTAAEATTTVEATTTTAAGGPATSFEDVQPATIQIEAQGSFRDPEVGMTTAAGRGSGFIISADGLAVTNNHVVTGAATLKVAVGGDSSTIYNARLVGVSECNDLALIQIDGEDFPTLRWAEGEPKVGTEVYAAGFPLGDPEYTLTRGIVAKAEAAGRTSWTSAKHVIEHDANIQPGNSGGPLVGADGSVIGVNYAGGSNTQQAQFFAIASELAQEVVDELYDGDFESLGINGSAVVDEEQGIAGIWVAGVAAGSPASDVGVKPGDIVTKLNGLPVGTDGTMGDYCDVIRTAGEGEPMTIEVLRFDTQEVLEGEINGDKVLEQTFSFAEEVAEEAPVEQDAPSDSYEYTWVVDDTGTIGINVPTAWAEHYTTPISFDDGSQAAFLQASTSITEMDASYNVPGIITLAVPGVNDVATSIAQFAPPEGECTSVTELTPFENSWLVGGFQLWSGCSGTENGIVILSATPTGYDYTVIMGVQFNSTADIDAMDEALNSFVLFPGG